MIISTDKFLLVLEFNVDASSKFKLAKKIVNLSSNGFSDPHLTGCNISPDESLVAVSSFNSEVYLLDAKNDFVLLTTLKGHSIDGVVTNTDFSVSGKILRVFIRQSDKNRKIHILYYLVAKGSANTFEIVSDPEGLAAVSQESWLSIGLSVSPDAIGTKSVLTNGATMWPKVAASRNQQWIAAGYMDGSIRLYRCVLLSHYY